MTSQCQCSSPVHAHDVVVGGGYVVGEGPTSANGFPIHESWTGRVVHVTQGPDRDGDVVVDDAVYIDPRHLTPAPDQAARAQTVDDDLLTDVAREIYLSFGVALPPVNHAYMSAVLQTQAFQRLRAAWTIDAVRERDDARWHRSVLDRCLVEARNSRDITQSELERLRTLYDAAAARIGVLVSERDEAIATADRLSRIGEQAALTIGDENRRLHSDTTRYVREIAGLEAELERLRTALPVLPDVDGVWRDGDGTVVIESVNRGYSSRDEALLDIACGTAALTMFDAEAAAPDNHNESEDKPTHRLTREDYGWPSGTGVKLVDWRYDESWLVSDPDGGSFWVAVDDLELIPDECPESSDPTPDTSRVTFGARHEVTGIVLLQHADLGDGWWGEYESETAEWHRLTSQGRGVLPSDHAAHAALAEVREALNTAEAHGVEVRENAESACFGWLAWDDDPQSSAEKRAHRYLAREVQALVDQGLRGDDLNARLPFEVRDHRAPVVTASEEEPEALAVARATGGDFELVDVERLIAALDSHRAARTSEEAGQ